MLEHLHLLLHAWAHGPAGWSRLVTGPGGESIGLVRFVGDPAGPWLSWFRGLRLEVFETQDESHLLTLTRSWGFLQIWEVYDSEDHHVGSIYSRSLATSENERIGFLDRDNNRILDPANKQLAMFHERGDAGLEVKFDPSGPSNPFLRMLLLSCVLTFEPTPTG